MGIDGIEFHPGYHQNLGTFQEVWLLRIFFGIKNCPPPVKSLFETTMAFHFFKRPFLVETLHNVFEINVGPREVPKLENLHFHLHALSGWGTS